MRNIIILIIQVFLLAVLVFFTSDCMDIPSEQELCEVECYAEFSDECMAKDPICNKVNIEVFCIEMCADFDD